MGDWNFLSDEERQRSARAARRPPLTWARVGRIAGGTVACWTTTAVCVLLFWLRWKFDLHLIAAFGTACVGALFAGAHVGGKVGAAFDPPPGGKPRG